MNPRLRLLRRWFAVVAAGSMILFQGEVRAGDFQDGATITFKHAPGPYSAAKYVHDFGKPVYVNLARARVVYLSDGEPALRVRSLAGKWDWIDSGAHLITRIPPRDEYSLEYRFRLGKADGSAIDFRRGGKLPGLAGGKANTGGRIPTGDGWSVRYMWREQGKLVVYLYHMDQDGKYGDDLPLNVRAVPGKWYKLKMRIRLNTDGRNNGFLKVWVDNKPVLERKDIRYRLGTEAPIDLFFFAHFWGGGDKSWAPQIDCAAYFRDFRLSK